MYKETHEQIGFGKPPDSEDARTREERDRELQVAVARVGHHYRRFIEGSLGSADDALFVADAHGLTQDRLAERGSQLFLDRVREQSEEAHRKLARRTMQGFINVLGYPKDDQRSYGPLSDIYSYRSVLNIPETFEVGPEDFGASRVDMLYAQMVVSLRMDDDEWAGLTQEEWDFAHAYGISDYARATFSGAVGYEMFPSKLQDIPAATDAIKSPRPAKVLPPVKRRAPLATLKGSDTQEFEIPLGKSGDLAA